MILLRRGRPAPMGSSFDVDVWREVDPTARLRRTRFDPWRPPVEVFETERDLVVRAEIGGLTTDSVSVQLVDGRLSIRGERHFSRPADELRVYHESRVQYGPFEVTVRLPFPVDTPLADAEYVDGILTVNLPRLTATKVATRDVGTIAAPSEEGSKR